MQIPVIIDSVSGMETVARYNPALRFANPTLNPTALESDSPYSSEQNLVHFAQKRLKKLFTPAGAICLMGREVGVGRSIADLVLLIAPKRVPGLFVPSLSAAESVILASLRLRGPTRIDLLEVRCGFQSRGLRHGALERMVDAGILVRGRGGRVALKTNYVEAGRIIAIEAKLTKWREALNQATLYRRYADEAHVLLPAQKAHPAIKARAEFTAAGVGLLIATHKSITSVFTASPSTDHDWRRDFIYSRLLAKRREASTNGSASQSN